MKPTVSIRVQNSKFTALTPLSNGYNTNVNITATSTRQVDVPIEILNIRRHLRYQKLHTIRPHTIPTKRTSTHTPVIINSLMFSLYLHYTTITQLSQPVALCSARCLPEYVRTVTPTQHKKNSQALL